MKPAEAPIDASPADAATVGNQFVGPAGIGTSFWTPVWKGIDVKANHPSQRCMFSHFQVVLAFGLWLALAPMVARAQGDDEPTPQELKRAAGLLQKLLDLNHGRFTLKGEVVDEQGQRLADVAVDIDKTRLKNMGERSESDSEKRIVHGAFNFSIVGYFSVRLMFTKAGYYSRTADFTMPSSGRALADIASGLTVEQQMLTKDGLRITLEKMGKVTRLLPYGGLLEYRSDGSAKVLNLNKSHVGRKALQVVNNAHDAGQLPTNGAYFFADQGIDGAILTTRIERPYGQNNVDTYPQRLTLIMNDPDGGFIPFFAANKKNSYHQMKEAPATGYQRQLVLDANYFAAASGALDRSRDDDMHFYFKSGGKYGKGQVGHVEVDEDGTMAQLGVALRVQPDGSRNVETDEGIGANFMPPPTDTTSPTITILGDRIEKLARAEHGRFVVSGELVDEQGQPLHNVTLKVEKISERHLGAEIQQEDETLNVNGSFDILLEGWTRLHMTFSKPGYYSARRSFAIELPPAAEEQAATGQDLEPTVGRQQGLRVVLEKMGELARLAQYRGPLEYVTDGQGKLINFEITSGGRTAVQTASDLHDPDTLPADCVYFLPDRGEDGRIAGVEVPAQGRPGAEILPSRIRLIINDPEGGFVPFTPAARRNIYHQMKVAPEHGYQREWLLDADYFRKAHAPATTGAEQYAYFHFKTRGRYGKGRIRQATVRDDRSRVLLGVEFRLQPNGSRNIETDEGPGRNFTPVVDVMPPVITVLGDNPAIVPCGLNYVDAGANAQDDNDGDLTASIVTSNTVATTTVGDYAVVYTVSDAAGNQATATRTVHVRYTFTGFLAPLGGAGATGGAVQDPLRTFKAGSKIPVKFTLRCGDHAVTTGAHTLQVIKWSHETTAEEPIDAAPADAASVGNQFRWADGHWQYVLDTQATGMTKGIWELRATLADGSTQAAFIGLR